MIRLPGQFIDQTSRRKNTSNSKIIKATKASRMSKFQTQASKRQFNGHIKTVMKAIKIKKMRDIEKILNEPKMVQCCKNGT
jgi:hypothetical protein